MPKRITISTRRLKRSSGSAIVEGAFVLLPTLAFIIGILDIGLMTYRFTTVQGAVREASRYAITFARQTVGGNQLGQDASIKKVVEQYAMGIVTTSDDPVHIFVKYYTPTNMNTEIPFASGGNVPGNLVEVSVDNLSYTGVFSLYAGQTIPVRAYSSAILGGYPVNVTSVPR